MSQIKVTRVERINQKVQMVVISIPPLSISFIERNGRIVKCGAVREDGARLYHQEQLRLSKEDYKATLNIAYAIFKSKNGRRSD